MTAEQAMRLKIEHDNRVKEGNALNLINLRKDVMGNIFSRIEVAAKNGRHFIGCSVDYNNFSPLNIPATEKKSIMAELREGGFAVVECNVKYDIVIGWELSEYQYQDMFSGSNYYTP